MPRSSTALSLLLLLGAALSFPAAAHAQPTPDQTTAPARTALQLHVDFFDRDGDGFIRVTETTKGLMAIGLPGGRVAAWVAAQAIHAGLPKTHGGGTWWRRTTIDTSIIHKGVHGSDTGAYDEDGKFVHEKFLAIFKHDVDGNDAIDSKELKAFYAANKTADGALASKAEFTILMLVAGEVNETSGLKELSRDTLQSLYDGSLFHKLEKKEQEKKAAAAKARAELRTSIRDRLSRLW